MADGTMKTVYTTFMEPTVFAGFLLDGTYLGDVRFPDGVGPIAFSGDRAWAVMSGDGDEPMLVRFQLPATGVKR